MDFSSVLALLLTLTGLIWVIDMAFYRSGRQVAGKITEPVIVQYARSFFPILLIVLIIRSFIFEPFRIPSESMMPGLIDGDFIFVNKFAYGLRLPVTNSEVLSTGQPRRGDVIVFRLPRDPSVHYIKRLVGLPGDHVVVRNNQVFVNGAPFAQIPDGTYSGRRFEGSDIKLEQIDNSEHRILLARSLPITDFEANVPPAHTSLWAIIATIARTADSAGLDLCPRQTSSAARIASGSIGNSLAQFDSRRNENLLDQALSQVSTQ